MTSAPVAEPARPGGHDHLLDMTAKPQSLKSMARDLWSSGSLIAILARKDFYVRYRRASLGLFWAVGLPLIQTATLALVFSRVKTFQVSGIPYPVFIFSGMLPWTYFSSTYAQASTSVVDNSGLSNKIYFPRSIMPIVNAVGQLYGFVISLALLLVMALVYGVGIGPQILVIVPATLLLVLLTLSFALVTSALHVYFRDLRYIVQAVLAAWFYVTPVVYNLKANNSITGVARTIVRANPATGVIELFRYAILGSKGLDPHWELSLYVTLAVTVVLFAGAVALHRKFDRVFSDLL